MPETTVKRKDDEVTGQGMSSVFMGSKWRRFIFWTLIFLLTVLTIKDVLTLFLEYKENEKTADMNIQFNQSMTLPTFTFCIPMLMVDSIFNSSKFKDKADFGSGTSENEAVKKGLAKLKTNETFLTKPWDRQMVKQAIGAIGLLHSLERESDDSFIAREISLLNSKGNNKLKKVNFWMKEIQKRNVTFDEFMEKAGHEVFRRMIKKSNRLSQLQDKKFSTGLKTTWISKGDICFQPTFKDEAAVDIDTQGNFYEIVFNHDPDAFSDKLHCIMVDMNGRTADMTRFLDSGGHTKDGVNDEICAGTTNDLLVELRAEYKMLENDDPGTSCTEDEDDGGADEFNCRAQCRTELIRTICQCTPITTQKLSAENDLEKFPPCDYEKCKVNVQTAAKSEKSCTKDCRRSCKVLRYEINLVGSKASFHQNRTSDEQIKVPHETRAQLSWGSFEFFRLEQNYKYESIVNFFC
ncbi:hypothetical protein M3Y94_00980700 [Aphelenchoides besseyi]|nr:hypothetical protein M3Y94_00980700 [Aphelenchoides besseyi]